MRAAILSIGDELVLGQSVDRNAAWLSEQLGRRSVIAIEHRTVPDDLAVIAAAIEDLAARSEVLVITGGLGPTEDDLTRQALGDVFTPGSALVVDEAGVAALGKWFTGRDRAMLEANLRQAHRPETMRLLSNRLGTAPGLAGEHRGCAVFALPGPPREMGPMFLRHVADAVTGAVTVRTEAVHEYGLGEAEAATRIAELTARDRNPLVGTTASDGVVSARIRADAAEGDRPDLEAVAARIEAAWSPYCFGRGSVTLAQSVGALLRARGATVATAESCTGGWVGKNLVDDAGASDYYRGGWITYADDFKTSCVEVPPDVLAREGAVSAPVASAMAAGALRRGGADYGLAVTGIAGPGGAVPGKPRGTVFIGVGRREAGAMVLTVRRFRFRGERTIVRDRSTKSALQMLRFALIGAEQGHRLLWESPEAEAGVEGVDSP